MTRRAATWADQADISARSVLVTILGDAIVPLGGEVWLSDLIELAEPFGFSSRLVRTSVSRLVGEGWVVGVRDGRRAKYHLTDFGRAESTQAEHRIYYPNPHGWTGEWTLVLTESQEHSLFKLLRWRGFGKIRPGVFARPSAATASGDNDPAGCSPRPTSSSQQHRVTQTGDAADSAQVTARELTAAIAQVDPAADPLVATAGFADLDRLVDHHLFRASLEIDRAEAAYRRFAAAYGWVDDFDPAALSPPDAFALRTMVIHDLRRLRLADPELPAELLPADWPGHPALDLAADIYRRVEAASWAHLESTTGLAADPDTALLANRFPNLTAPQPSRSLP